VSAADAPRATSPAPVALAALSERLLSDAVRLLSAALGESPLNRALVPGSPRRRRRAVALGLSAQLPQALRHGRVLGAGPTDGPLEGVLVGASPWAHPFPAPSMARRVTTALLQGPSVAGRLGEVFGALLDHRPRDAHWYLSLLGVRGAARGRGVGRALLAAWLTEVDAARGPAWLETDEPANLRFYGAAGFAVREEIRLLGVPVWLLARAPRTPR
jgi:ribosomal protein S18 acetylase RimI-like enzyme